MKTTTAARRLRAPALAIAAAGLAATLAAPFAAAQEIEIVLGPTAGQISHPTITVEVGDVLVYRKLSVTTPFHILEHLEILPGQTYQQAKSRCAAAYTNFAIECHWVDIILVNRPPADVIGVPGPPPAGNAGFYGTVITSTPHTFRWDIKAWQDQMVVGYLGKQPFTQPREFLLIDAMNSQQIQQRVTIVPAGWFAPPTLSLPGSITTNATSPAGAAVSYVASATGYGGAAVPVACAPASGSTFAIGSTTVTCTANGNGESTSTGTFDVHVKGASEQLTDLAALTNGVGPGNSLSSKALEIQAKLAAGQTADACADLLRSYPNSVTAQAGKKLTQATADALLAEAARIAAVVGCTSAAPASTGGMTLVLPLGLLGLVAGRRRGGARRLPRPAFGSFVVAAPGAQRDAPTPRFWRGPRGKIRESD